MKPVYLKIAVGNVKKSYRDFMIYFMTLTFSVCLFYVFNSFDAQQKIMMLSTDQEYYINLVATFMLILSFFVVFVFGFLILYANNFLIKRRKKEFGLYMLMGMPKKKISRILIYETLFIGLISLISGLLLGLAVSQLTAILVAALFKVEVNFHFVYSSLAMLMTVLCFALIFVVIMLFNTRILNHYKLSQLLTAEKANEKKLLMSLPVSIVLFIVSLLFLGAAYFLASYSTVTFVEFFGQILVLGIIGTMLFFFSLSGFLLFFIKRSRKFYFHNLNMFVLKQINAKINTNFISMGIICLMLLLSIGALATGLNLNEAFSNDLTLRTPYDTSIVMYEHDLKQEDMYRLSSGLDIESSDWVELIRSDVDESVIFPMLPEKSKNVFANATASIVLISVSDYNKLMHNLGQREIHLAADEALITCDMELIQTSLQGGKYAGETVTVFGRDLHLINDQIDVLYPYTMSQGGNYGIFFIVNDELTANEVAMTSIWNINFSGNADEQSDELSQRLSALRQENSEILGSYQLYTRTVIMMSDTSFGMIFTFIGLYLGIVFAMASTVILALQQLSDASDNRQRYQVLSKLGADRSQINHAVYLQIGLYFILPLGLAVLHSYIGINAVCNAFSFLGIGNVTKSALITAALFMLVYGLYYWITVQGVKSILRKAN